MKSAVIVFPGSNCDRDIAVALKAICGGNVDMVWHGERNLPKVDLVAVPGGFSYGDYLRPGAMAAHSPVMESVVKSASMGVAIIGICNGFQVLTECGLLPGILMRNRDLKFICRATTLEVATNDSLFTPEYTDHDIITMPIAHNEGNYFADQETLEELESEDRIAFRYSSRCGTLPNQISPNGSANSIAGILSSTRRVLGMMPHPERAVDENHVCKDGQNLFKSLVMHLA